MAIFASSLMRGFAHMETVAKMMDGLDDPQIGVELIAFTHDNEYWQRLQHILKQIQCPITFHGPFINVEGTAPVGTPEHKWLIESYTKVFDLAACYKVRHVVFHTTQMGFEEWELEPARQSSYHNISQLLEMAENAGVTLLFENLPYPREGLPLYDNQWYARFFDDFPKAFSLIDIGHAHMNRLELAPLLHSLGNRVLGYHCHNNDGLHDQHNRIGDGSFDFGGFASLLKQYTPNANIVLEYEPHTNCTQSDIQQDIQQMRSLLLR